MPDTPRALPDRPKQPGQSRATLPSGVTLLPANPDLAGSKATPEPPARQATGADGEPGEDPRIAAWRAERAQQANRLIAMPRDRFEDKRLGFIAGSLPLGILATLLLTWLVIPVVFLEWFTVWFHEIGHAVIFWLSGRPATPLSFGPGIGWTSGHLEPNLFTRICFTFLIGVIGFQGIKHRSRFLIGLAAALLMGELYFWFIADEDTWEAIMIFSGIGGQMILGALLVVGFYYRLPDPLRWDFFRFPALAVGLFSYGKCAWLWTQIHQGRALIPMGSFRSNQDAGGDMNRLLAGHLWDEGFLIRVYVFTALICGLVILGHYAFFTWRAYFAEKASPDHPER